ncbi:MAG: alpha-ketoacid dehydrogenase subunit beta [Alphaproteobacteria bacterium]|nr:alpha-ketoacid dehydrogenase subunit beta [Alphaproteobacteria bacterium]
MPDAAPRALSYVDALREAAAQEMERDPRVFVMGLDVDDHKGIQGSTKGLVDRFGPERVFTTPLSEDAMTGVAIGAAQAGLRPIHVHIRMDFLMLCMNQLVNIAAKSRYMYGGQVKVPMVVRAMIGKSWGQGAQHSQGLHAMFMHVPGIKVLAPSNAHDAKGCLIAAIRDDNPVLMVEHRLLYPLIAEVPEAPYAARLGEARVLRKGTDITLLGISAMVPECLRAAELLREIGIDAEVIDPISLVPFDRAALAASVRKTGRLLAVDSAWTMCGASAEVAAMAAEDAPGVRIARLGFAPTTCPTAPSLEHAFYPNPAVIAARAHVLVRPDAKTWRPSPEAERSVTGLNFKGPF